MEHQDRQGQVVLTRSDSFCRRIDGSHGRHWDGWEARAWFGIFAGFGFNLILGRI